MVWGGDLQDLPTEKDPKPRPWLRRTEFEYSYGVLSRVQRYLENGVTAPFADYDTDIDRSSGRVLASRDPNGRETAYVHDESARVTNVIPQDGAQSALTYTPPTPGVPAATRVQVFDGLELYLDYEVSLDEFGRPWRSVRQLPGGLEQVDEIGYAPAGWVDWRSSPGDETLGTSYEFDALGRPTRMVPPEGAAHAVLFSYVGNRVTIKASSTAAGPLGQEVSTKRRYEHDATGQLTRVVIYPDLPPSGSPELGIVTEYGYDVAGRLTRAVTTSADGTVAQLRERVYDNRGFLLEETLPEKGADGNGTVYFSSYDVGGNPGSTTDGGTTLHRTYDGLDRLLTVTDGSGRLLAEYTYDTAAGDGLARLAERTAHNWRALPWTPGEVPIPVTESFRYEAPNGEVSRYDIGVAGYAEFYQTYTYAESGDLASRSYPQCLAPECMVAPDRVLQYEADLGQTVGIPGWVDQVDYASTGSWRAMDFANGLTHERVPDPHGRIRPAEYRALAPDMSIPWTTGSYEYDGNGKPKTIGPARYQYDGAGRLAQTEFTPLVVEQYAYDDFGNLIEVGTQWSPSGPIEYTDLSTDPETNRLVAAQYDARGNVAMLDQVTYSHDELGRLKSLSDGAEERTYLYAASGLRLWTISTVQGDTIERWELRDLDGRVLRRLGASGRLQGGVQWSWLSDNVFVGGSLIGKASPTGDRWLHTDQVGSVRAASDGTGAIVSTSDYSPFGSLRSGDPAEGEGFGPNEREYFGDLTLDYVKNRYSCPDIGRFLQVDPKFGSMRNPQLLNRYAFVGNDPLTLVDADGLEGEDADGDCKGFCEEIEVNGESDSFADEITIQDYPGSNCFYGACFGDGDWGDYSDFDELDPDDPLNAVNWEEQTILDGALDRAEDILSQQAVVNAFSCAMTKTRSQTVEYGGYAVLGEDGILTLFERMGNQAGNGLAGSVSWWSSNEELASILDQNPVFFFHTHPSGGGIFGDPGDQIPLNQGRRPFFVISREGIAFYEGGMTTSQSAGAPFWRWDNRALPSAADKPCENGYRRKRWK